MAQPWPPLGEGRWGEELSNAHQWIFPYLQLGKALLQEEVSEEALVERGKSKIKIKSCWGTDGVSARKKCKHLAFYINTFFKNWFVKDWTPPPSRWALNPQRFCIHSLGYLVLASLSGWDVPWCPSSASQCSRGGAVHRATGAAGELHRTGQAHAAGEPHTALRRTSLVWLSSRRSQFICFLQQNLTLAAANLANPVIHHLNPGLGFKQGAQIQEGFPQRWCYN